MTDTEIARRIRAAAQAMRDPLSVNCVACKVMAGVECVETEGSGKAPHRIRSVDARLTADGKAGMLMVELAKESA